MKVKGQGQCRKFVLHAHDILRRAIVTVVVGFHCDVISCDLARRNVASQPVVPWEAARSGSRRGQWSQRGRSDFDPPWRHRRGILVRIN